MLRPILRSLARIRYYSAPRASDPLSQLRRRLTVVALALSPLPLLVLEAMVSHTGFLVSARAGLERQADGAVSVRVEKEGEIPWGQGLPIGEVEFGPRATTRGWPMTTLHMEAVPLVLMRRLYEGSKTVAVAEAEDQALWTSVSRAILEADPSAAQWIQPAPDQRDRLEGRRWWQSAVIVVASMIVLDLTAALFISLLRGGNMLTSAARSAARRRRAARNQCLNCGYDMAGLEFHERCPECGTLVG